METEKLLELTNLKVKNLRVFLDNLDYILECEPNIVHPDGIISSNQNSIDTCKKNKNEIVDIFNSIEEINDMNKPIIKEYFADNGEHSHWEVINSENGEVLWTEDELNKRVEYVPIKSIAQGSICYDDFRNEKTIFVAKDKILFKTNVETFRMPLSGQRTDKKYFVIVFDNNERIFCNETEFNNI